MALLRLLKLHRLFTAEPLLKICRTQNIDGETENSNAAAGVAPVSRGTGAVAVRLEWAEYLFGPWWIPAKKKLTRAGRYQDPEVQRELILHIQNII